jgi:hypothetical protein
LRPYTDKKLRNAFELFNEKYFESKIRETIEVRYGDDEDCDDCDGLSSEDFIYVHKDFKYHPDMGLIVLLHEMQHCFMHQKGYNAWKDEGGHHMLFFAGIDRLYKAGAYEGLL